MTKKIAILQSNYIPWKGYFDIISAVDEFVIYDDVQYTKNDWRNRNKIKTAKGTEWLSIPVGQNLNRRIRDVQVPQSGWQKKHWKTIVQNYQKAPHFQEIASIFEPLYLERNFLYLTELNRTLIETVCTYTDIQTLISNSWDYHLGEGKTERLVDLCRQAGGTEYISGPAAKDYLDEKQFNDAGIKVSWFDYSGYPQYPQLWGGFEHGVSVLDVLFNTGPEAPWYIYGWRNTKKL